MATRSLLECSNYYSSRNKNNELAIVINNVIEFLVIIDDHVADSNWELAVLDGLDPLSKYLKSISLSNELLSDDFKRYLQLASIDLELGCQITGCIVQAASAGENLTNGGENIIKAGESLKVTCPSVAQNIVDVGECLSTFGIQLSNGKFI